MFGKSALAAAMRHQVVVGVIAFIIGLPVVVAGEDQAPALEVQVPSSAVSVGDRIAVRALARGGADMMWGELRVLVEANGPWELIDGPRPVVGSRPPAWELTLVAMEVGETPFPDFEVSVRPPNGEPIAVKPAEVPTITVATVLASEEDVEPAPLRDPVGVGGFPWEWLPPALLILAPILLAVLWWALRKKVAAAAAQVPLLPPFQELEVAYQGLRERIGRDPAEGVCDRLASALRRYLERRSGDPAMEMTSFELRLLGRRLGWPETVQRGVQQAMDVADGVRFGKRDSSDTQLGGAVDIALAAAHGLEAHLRPVGEENETAEEAVR